jgi:hypothetical protein
VSNLFDTLAAKGTATLPDGRVLRLTEEPDYDTRINDFECYGRVEQCENDRDTGQTTERPKGFDGMAEKVLDCYGNAYWWQPTPRLWGIEPADWYADDKMRRESRQEVIDLLSFGFKVITLELCEGADFYGRPIVVDAYSTGGVECMADAGHLASIAEDLAFELSLEVEA